MIQLGSKALEQARVPEPVITPAGALVLRSTARGPALPEGMAAQLQPAFERGAGHGLLWLGAGAVRSSLPGQLAYWRGFAGRYVAAMCGLPGIADERTKPRLPPPSTDMLEALARSVPPMLGAEYLTAEVLTRLWQQMDAACDAELAASGGTVQAFLKRLDPAWNLVGRVHFNLAENRKDEAAPFAFLATYTTGLSATAKAQHLPLGKALQEYAGAGNKERLLSLLMPVQRAAEACDWLKQLVDAGAVYHPLRWTPAEALRLLRDASALEAAGVVLRMPSAWRMGRPPNPRVTATVGANAPAGVGVKALMDFDVAVTLDGETLSKDEIAALLAQGEGLAFIRGQWVEIDRDRLARTLDQMESAKARADADGLPFAEAMRLLAGAGIGAAGTETAAPEVDWSQTIAGPWLAQTLADLRRPGTDGANPGTDLRATLRPYQLAGVQWLHLLARLGLGACLADDMGLGKTIQVISLLLVLKREAGAARKASLLVAPASVIANWAAEVARFAPGLTVLIAHPSAMPAEALKALGPETIDQHDLVVTTYGTLPRSAGLSDHAWRVVALDEAQAIKNPGTKQTKAVKVLKGEVRIALTGTPIENRLGDLWSIFDFVNPGLLGTAKQFTSFTKSLAEKPGNAYGPLRELVKPYILRRMKSDRSIIADLPDKTEVKTYCSLSKRQAALYAQAVTDLKRTLEDSDGIARRGVVLAALMRFKQICNHPSQWLGDGAWDEDDSGKLARLREIMEEIGSRQEKALVFTQFAEITQPLAAFLGGVFGRPGLVLDGSTPVKRRKELVARFQDDEAVPFFVISVKAGGAGLNLTAASHVIHFDRWWNPAVENQATDRAYRIGQKRNVLVHKFVCRGTIEDKIDQLIEFEEGTRGGVSERRWRGGSVAHRNEGRRPAGDGAPGSWGGDGGGLRACGDTGNTFRWHSGGRRPRKK